jgi:uncharacterized protein YkwD
MDVPRPPSSHIAPALRKQKAKRRLIIIAVGIVILAGGYWYFQKFFSLRLASIAEFGSSLGTSVIGQPSSTQNFSAPGPLVVVSKAVPKKANALTSAGVIADTNQQRVENGNLPPLAENATLDDIAMLRIDDLFQQQYFAHVGPQGESAVTVASSVGYSYLALGENLALGVYAGDAGVVTAWMNSPGHRANILNTHYTQIGVAVREGVFQGQTTWIAVQVFGRPSSDCTSPSVNLQTSITLSENQITAMANQLSSDKSAIDAMNPQSGPTYNEQVEDYNNLAEQYNNLAAETKNAINEYNLQVSVFNNCLAE